MSVHVESFALAGPPDDIFTPADELERLLVALVHSENLRLAAPTPQDGERIKTLLGTPRSEG